MSPAHAMFQEAVLDLSEAPTKANIVRYLNASRALDGQPLRDRPAARASGKRTRSST